MYIQNEQQMKLHITIVGWLHISNGLLALLIGALVYFFLSGVGAAIGDPQAVVILGLAGTFIGGLLLILGLPGVVAGFGLLAHKSWSRYLAITLSVFNLFNVPVGTVIGIYTVWVLMQEKAAMYFTQTSPGTAYLAGQR